MASRLVAFCLKLVKRYEDAIIKDPLMASKIESMLKIISYIVPGRFGGGNQFSELAYSVSNLYTLLNDFIMSKNCPAASVISKLPLSQQRLLWLLALMDSTEVVFEVFGEYWYRELGKWLTVLILKMTKAIIQCVVVYRYKSRILTSPNVPAIDRKKLQMGGAGGVATVPEGQPVAYRGARTGRIIRSIHADPGLPYTKLSQYIDNNVPQLQPMGVASMHTSIRDILTTKELVAEGLHISRPLVHIFSMFVFQQSSWKPWLISLMIDILSLHLHKGLTQFKTTQSSEILRRRLVLLLYLMRSPFYNRYIKDLLASFLQYMSSHIPLASFIADPLLEYIPVWIDIYSYNWMS
jgi:peroxin-16